jgi:hypothetical protein
MCRASAGQIVEKTDYIPSLFAITLNLSGHA